jgi:hypothetical protein
MLSKKIVEKLAKDMESAAKADFDQHMARLVVGFEMMVPVVEQMREAGLSLIEIADVLRGLALRLTEDDQPESDDTE